MQQLLSYAALGVREGVLIELAPRPQGAADNVETYSSSLVFVAGVGLLLPLVFSFYSLASSGVVDPNYLLCALIGSFSVVNEVLINLNRYEGRLLRVSFCEISYSLIALGLILALHNVLTVAMAQGAILIAVAFSVTVYLFHLRSFSLRAVTMAAMRRLVGVGLFPAMLSAVLLLVNVMFILLAQRHLPKAEAGQYVFANNIATLLLVSLNAFSWAMTSRTIGDIASASADQQHWLRVQRTDVYLRVGVALAVLGALCIAVVLPLVFVRYADSTRFILLFVALQSLPLIAFTEMNFLMLHRKAGVAALIFGAASALNYGLVELLAGRLPFEMTMMMAFVIAGLAMIVIMRYAASQGFAGTHPLAKVASAGVLLAMAVVHYAFGTWVALVCALSFVLAVVKSNWRVLRPA